MTSMKFGRHLLAATVLVFAGTAHGATVYQLNSITLNTGNAPGTYNFGAGPLLKSVCISCGTGTVTDDGLGNLTVGEISYRLAGFGADFIDTFTGAATLGVGTSLIKNPGETCFVNFAVATPAPQYCTTGDQRTYSGNWLTGFLADGTTPSTHAAFNAVVSGNTLVMNVRKDLVVGTPGPTSWLQLNFNYTAVVPVPAAVWLFGSALGILGIGSIAIA